MINLKIIKQENNILFCETIAGANFDNVYQEAINFIKKNQSFIVQYEFNGINLSVNKDSTLSIIQKLYDEQIKIKEEKLKNSDEYKKEQELYQLKQQKYKFKTQSLINSFDKALTSKSSLIKWLGEFANSYSYAPIACNKKEFAEKIKSHGYVYKLPNQNELNQLDEKSKLEVSILSNSYKALSNNQPIPPVAYKFYLQYVELEKKENIVKNISSKKNKQLSKKS
jgi:hypothetical protein